MERQEIETFLALCEELHFGRTAKRLRISPARVTQLIQKTERRIGGALFERTTRGVVLTDLGRQLQRDLAPAHRAVEEAIRLAVPMHVIASSLFARFQSRQDDSPAMKAIAALRKQFGGHAVKKG